MNSDVTHILRAIEGGDANAASALLPLIYEELRTLAAQRMRAERVGHTLGATALVHEAYMRLVDGGSAAVRWNSRGHFFAAAAEAMRRILIDGARRRGRVKHGGGRVREELAEQVAAPLPLDDQVDVLALDEALAKLAAEDAGKAELVKLRYFAGLSVEEAAAILEISRATADRWWAYARAFLYCEMRGEGGR
jgi:RNA polymerase sigma factor (TIGR02999 family)